MRFLITKYKYFLNFIKGRQGSRRMKILERETLILKSQKKSDFNRWKKSSELFEDWNERTFILASFVEPNSKVIEFGAGNMCLKNNLPLNCIYTPSDIFKRFDETIVCDLNETITFDLCNYNTAVFSGVLEYVYDIEIVFEQMHQCIPQVIMSYACSDVCSNNRLANGWLSSYTQNQLVEIFSKFNYNIIESKVWREQVIFNLKK